jgi:hypothetical protein
MEDQPDGRSAPTGLLFRKAHAVVPWGERVDQTNRRLDARVGNMLGPGDHLQPPDRSVVADVLVFAVLANVGAPLRLDLTDDSGQPSGGVLAVNSGAAADGGGRVDVVGLVLQRNQARDETGDRERDAATFDPASAPVCLASRLVAALFTFAAIVCALASGAHASHRQAT